MRVNIITQPLFINYGGILQNYALQETLRRLGHEPLTINVPVKAVCGGANWKDYVKVARNLILKWQGVYSAPFLNPHTFAVKERELSFPQREFIDKHISKVDCLVPFMPELEKEYPADLWIVGSDQVWRPWCSPNIENYFFNFLSDKTKRIAYAASFGTDQWEISEELTPKVRELVSRFTAVSVRENSGVELCKRHLGIEATHVLDPTMLLQAEDYLSLTSDNDYPKGKYIATYVLDTSREKNGMIEIESKRNNMPVVKVGTMHKDQFDSIESWLASIAHAEYVITDSFHGTVFSLIFRRPVKVLSNNTRGNARLQSLFDMLQLKPDSDGYIRLGDDSIERLNHLGEEALTFINKSLTNNG